MKQCVRLPVFAEQRISTQFTKQRKSENEKKEKKKFLRWSERLSKVRLKFVSKDSLMIITMSQNELYKPGFQIT